MRPSLLELATLVVESVNLHHVDPASLTEATSLTRGGLELDSIDLLEVVVSVEQKFGVKIRNADEGRKAFATFGSLADFIASHESRS